MIGSVALTLLALTIASYFFARTRAVQSVGGKTGHLHSRPTYHGLYTFLWTGLISFGFLIVVNIASGLYIDYNIRTSLPEDIQGLPKIQQEQIVDQAKSIAKNKPVVGVAATDRAREVRDALAEQYATLSQVRYIGIAIIALLAFGFTFWVTYSQIDKDWRARNRSERLILYILLLCAVIAIMTTVGIVFALMGPTLKFFFDVSVLKFLFGTHWSPLSGVFEGKVDENTVGAIPLFAGTFMIAFIAMFVAVPIGLMAAIYLSDYAGSKIRSSAKPLLEILAGIPTVVYGFFAALTVAPFIRDHGDSWLYFLLFFFGPMLGIFLFRSVLRTFGLHSLSELFETIHLMKIASVASLAAYFALWFGYYEEVPSFGLSIASESALAAGVVMGIMIIPFISSLSDDIINAVPQSLRDGSYGVGATKAETITKVILPAALPGIVSAILLGFSRAVGETMIVVMAAGQGANLTWNPLEAMTTVTVQIVALITGDTEADTAAGPAFALGFTLFAITLAMNVIALRIVQKYRQKYD
ncbi:MAG: PstC family ABC transporter permease [Pseudomonadota bacterium]